MIICKYVFLSRFNGFFVVHNFEYVLHVTAIRISWLIYNNVLFIIQSNMASKNKNYEKKGRERGRDEYENQFYLWNVSTGNVWKEKKIAWSQSHRKADYYMYSIIYFSIRPSTISVAKKLKMTIILYHYILVSCYDFVLIDLFLNMMLLPQSNICLECFNIFYMCVIQWKYDWHVQWHITWFLIIIVLYVSTLSRVTVIHILIANKMFILIALHNFLMANIYTFT